MTDRKIDYIALDEVVPDPGNPKGHDDELIAASIDRLGYISPATMDERVGMLIEGHGRLEALRVRHARGEAPPEGIRRLKDGRWAMPVTRGWSSANDEERVRALIVLNRATELGGWEPQLLHAAVLALPDLELTGWATLDDLPQLELFPATGPRIVPFRPKRPPTATRVAAVQIVHGDMVAALAALGAESLDAVVCDPPYELGFMGKEWDASGVAYRPATWQAVLRVLKPGGHLLAFGGSRTYHRMGVAIEDAGFDVRDSIHWIYGEGFPKSLDVAKAIDDKLGVEREVLGVEEREGRSGGIMGRRVDIARELTEPASDQAKAYEGWGTALKPAHEPIIVARKPVKGTIADNVLAHGTGAINIDGTRVETDEQYIAPGGEGWDGHTTTFATGLGVAKPQHEAGRWPPNVVLDEAAAAEMDRQSGITTSAPSRERAPDPPAGATWGLGRTGGTQVGHDDEGGASRFFPVFRYEAKASTAERNAGLEHLDGTMAAFAAGPGGWDERLVGNHHSTVKPVELMRWLVRLVTPAGGTVLDPFAGSGTTLVAAVLEGFDVIGVEQEAEYLPIIEGRVAWAHAQVAEQVPVVPGP